MCRLDLHCLHPFIWGSKLASIERFTAWVEAPFFMQRAWKDICTLVLPPHQKNITPILLLRGFPILLQPLCSCLLQRHLHLFGSLPPGQAASQSMQECLFVGPPLPEKLWCGIVSLSMEFLAILCSSKGATWKFSFFLRTSADTT